jgi:nitrate/nitrite-specific signal transduction histidine kinase
MNSVLGRASPTRRLTVLYIIALSTVALLTILGQIVIQLELQRQSSDALVINIAGRQRMLSQRLSKAALALDVFSTSQERQQNLTELQSVIVLWQSSQEGLQHGDSSLGLPGNNSPTIKHLFATIQPNYVAMLHAAKALQGIISAYLQHPTVRAPNILPDIRIILREQSGFLAGMDRIVSQYQLEAEDHVAVLRRVEYLLLGLTLLVLLLEGLLIFRPVVIRLRETITDLMEANERILQAEFTRKRAERILALNEALAASRQEVPHARIMELDHYQVRDKGGVYHDVYHREVDGQWAFVCVCAQYEQQGICAHSLAAAALHRISERSS